MNESVAPSPGVLSAAFLSGLIEQLQQQVLIDEPGVCGQERVERIKQFERLKSVAAAGQAVQTAALHTAATADRTASQRRQEKVRRSVASDVALARRSSPSEGNKLVGAALALTQEMPHTLAALTAGEIGEYQATLVVQQTSTLTREHREAVDAELAGRLGQLGLKATTAETARCAYRLDPAQAIKRLAKAESESRVSVRPAPDGMAYLTGLVRLDHGVAAWAALDRYASTCKALGDTRSRGQIMAAELVARMIAPRPVDPATPEGSPAVDAGQDGPAGKPTTTGDLEGDNDATAAAAALPEDPQSMTSGLQGLPTGVGVDIQLVMTDRTLLDGDDEPAILTGFGPVPAPLARHLIRGADPTTRIWVRRLYTDPTTGNLVGADQRRRLFPAAARHFLITRDQVCRNSWCGAPIRHADHITPYHHTGRTDLKDAQGLCEHCNHVKEAPGWTHRAEPDGTITVTTPTGHHYRNTPPRPPKSTPWTDPPPSPIEKMLRARLRRYGNITWVSSAQTGGRFSYEPGPMAASS